MDLTEHRLSRETIYEGKILHIYRDDVLLPNGRKSVREVADHPGGVAIVALDDLDVRLTHIDTEKQGLPKISKLSWGVLVFLYLRSCYSFIFASLAA